MTGAHQQVRIDSFLKSREEYGGSSGSLLSLSVAHGVVPRGVDDGRAASENLDSYRLVRPGDLVVNKLVARDGAFHISRLAGSVSPAYWVLVADESVALPNFLNYACKSLKFLGEVRRLSKDMPPAQYDLPWPMFKSMRIDLPSVDEQRVVADFLDRETAMIDALIEKQTALIDRLHERRLALVDVAFQPSSLNTRTRVQHLIEERPRYGVLVPSYVDEIEESVPFIRVGDLLHLDPDKELLRIGRKQSWEFRRTSLRGGEVLLGVVGKMGQASIAPDWLAGANVARAVAVLRCCDSTRARLLHRWLSSTHFLDQANLATSGDSIQPTLGMADLYHFEAHWPAPPAAEELADYLDRETAKIDALIFKTERMIELSREHRAALITAAVTGQIDVAQGVA